MKFLSGFCMLSPFFKVVLAYYLNYVWRQEMKTENMLREGREGHDTEKRSLARVKPVLWHSIHLNQ